MADFWADYRDDRWLRTAKRVRERAGHKCEECGEDKESLHVHHTYYERGRRAWDYPDESLRCWCTYCHGLFHDLKDQVNRLAGGMTIRTFEWLKVAAKQLLWEQQRAALEECRPEWWAAVKAAVEQMGVATEDE